VPFTVAAASWQILVVYFVVACFRFFFYHETLSNLPANRLKRLALTGEG
jgi:hypothetical protein